MNVPARSFKNPALGRTRGNYIGDPVDFGVKDPKYYGIVGTARKYLTSEGREYARKRADYKSKLHYEFPKARIRTQSPVPRMMESGTVIDDDGFAFKKFDPLGDAQFFRELRNKYYGPYRITSDHRPNLKVWDMTYPDNTVHRVTAPVGSSYGHIVTIFPNKNELYDSAGALSYPEHRPTNIRIQENGTCMNFAGIRSFFPEASNKQFNDAIHKACARTGMTPDEVVLDITDQLRKAPGLKKTHNPLPEFRSGGVIMAKESYKKDPKNVGDYELVKKTPTMLLYKKGNEFVVSIRGTAELQDIVADLSLPFNRLSTTGRYKRDREAIKKWKEEYPDSKWTGVGHSLGGAILDEFIKEGLVEEGTSYNPAIQPGNVRKENERIHSFGDPLYVPLIGSKVVGRKSLNPHSLENFEESDKKNSSKKEMKHMLTDVPLVEKGKKFLGGSGGKLKEDVVSKVKRASKKVKEVAEKVGREVVKEAKKHSHHLIEGGKKVGKAGGSAVGVAVGSLTENPVGVEVGRRGGEMIGEKLGELVGRKIHEKVQSLKKGGAVKRVKKGEQLLQVTDTKPVEHKKEVVKKKTNQALKDVQAIRKAKGVSLKDAWAMYKSG